MRAFRLKTSLMMEEFWESLLQLHLLRPVLRQRWNGTRNCVVGFVMFFFSLLLLTGRSQLNTLSALCSAFYRAKRVISMTSFSSMGLLAHPASTLRDPIGQGVINPV